MHYYRHIVKYQGSKHRNYFLNLLNVEDYKLQLNKLQKYELKRYKELWRELPVIMDSVALESSHRDSVRALTGMFRASISRAVHHSLKSLSPTFEFLATLPHELVRRKMLFLVCYISKELIALNISLIHIHI